MSGTGHPSPRLTIRPPWVATRGTLPAANRSERPQTPPSPWMDDAACIGAPEDFVVPDDGAKLAARYCSGCPVADQCLAFGRRTRGYGVWGGLMLVDGLLAVSAVSA